VQLPDYGRETAPKHRALSASAVILLYMLALAVMHGIHLLLRILLVLWGLPYICHGG